MRERRESRGSFESSFKVITMILAFLGSLNVISCESSGTSDFNRS